jgi:hypothetical protein
MSHKYPVIVDGVPIVDNAAVADADQQVLDDADDAARFRELAAILCAEHDAEEQVRALRYDLQRAVAHLKSIVQQKRALSLRARRQFEARNLTE